MNRRALIKVGIALTVLPASLSARSADSKSQKLIREIRQYDIEHDAFDLAYDVKVGLEQYSMRFIRVRLSAIEVYRDKARRELNFHNASRCKNLERYGAQCCYI